MQALREAMSWDGGERVLGRHYKFTQDLAHSRSRAWRDSRTNVLAIYRESGIVALFDEDHRMFADIANHYRPGSGRYVRSFALAMAWMSPQPSGIAGTRRRDRQSRLRRAQSRSGAGAGRLDPRVHGPGPPGGCAGPGFAGARTLVLILTSAGARP